LYEKDDVCRIAFVSFRYFLAYLPFAFRDFEVEIRTFPLLRLRDRCAKGLGDCVQRISQSRSAAPTEDDRSERFGAFGWPRAQRAAFSRQRSKNMDLL